MYYLTVIIRLFSFNLQFICTSVICKKLKLHSAVHSPYAVLIPEKHTRANKAALIMYTTGGGKRIFGGSLKNFLREKWGMVKISEGRKRKCQFF